MKVLAILALVTISGCSVSGRTTLGETSTISPGWERLKQASVQAFHDPHVWAPLVGAAVLQINDLDEQISDDLREDTPLFGSEQDALDASDDFEDWTKMAYVTTALITPGPDSTGDWLMTKGKLLTGEYLAVEAADLASTELKDTIKRERPNGYNKKSTPSGHSVRSSTQAQMTQLNIKFMPISDTSKQVLDLSINGVAALSAYARVEGGMHYPSDVLFGWALGRFVGHIATAFILPDQQNIMIIPQITEDSGQISLVYNF